MRIGVLLVLAGLSAGCRFGPEQWGPFRGRIVDAETGAPIAGAHFMVMWERDNPNPVHWTQSFYDAQEAVTGADGRFEIPRRQRFITLLVRPPRFSAFAAGYVAESEQPSDAGQLYVADTILKMRRLRSRKEQCVRRPGEPAAPGAKVPLFLAAVQEYNLRLDCAGLDGER
jgi:hypothetical protein